ncbi:Tim44 domain-containing protein [Chelatococcus sp. SYSU_G07232]|uniref:Tim44 domain-containing protein n=1 Tax=Chelatococcus albus TaxID=3047466 RepID=A0ABT7AKA3_9HYPH|nr:Tim44 domain-containing protein [Chelatococcus sp. SYSU_G07232]MDJ1159264.1 Tim44 domain-containing protein [Chelatococcus sp. SYSU_G07232]
MSLSTLSRRGRFFAVAAVALVLAAGAAEARSGSGRTSGSRGSRTYDAAPTTQTAPRQAQPIERSMTQPGATQPGAPTARPGFGQTAPAQARPGFFSGGFGKALLGGLVGAGLIGLLTGSGLFGGFSGLASLFGLLLQAGLIVGLIMLAVRFFRSRQQPAPAGLSPAMASMGAGPQGDAPIARSALGGSGIPNLGASLGGPDGPARAAAAPRDEIGLTPTDFDAFEKALCDVQLAYGREDLAVLRELTTPEMVSFFAEDLAQNARDGVVNRIAEPRLLQGDLSEAWREADADYATVAMRFSLLDTMVERGSGRIVSGDATKPSEVTELWTFRRARGEGWKLSAIQQA